MYDKLLSNKRRRESSRGTRPLRDEVESDRSRVIYSAAFRRLQRKTQVFPLEDNAAVRTRMTHSLEVAHVGRFLGGEVIERFRNQGSLPDLGLDNPDTQHSFQTVIEIACLIHDLGNPPFGHFGEVAVSRWFDDGDRKLSHHDLPNFHGFDGNPQGFRIISRLAGADGTTGMNLTLTQLASTLKYPVTATEKSYHHFKKFGVFDTEREILDQIREEFSLQPGQRFPLAYLMEAADDISYCLSDMEDGVEKGLISYQKIIDDLKSQAKEDESLLSLIRTHSDKAEKVSEVDKTVVFRSSLITDIVGFSADQYVKSHDEIVAGTPTELIPDTSTEGKLLKLIKKTVRQHVYSDRSIETLELSGLAAISSLFKHFGKLIELDKRDFEDLLEGRKPKKNCDVERRLIGFLGETHLNAYRKSTQISPTQEKLFRAHMVVDYISGMTDGFAVDMHQILEGLKIQ